MEPRTAPSPVASADAAPSPRAEAAAAAWHAKPAAVVLAALETSPDGLTDAEARRRLAQNLSLIHILHGEASEHAAHPAEKAPIWCRMNARSGGTTTIDTTSKRTGTSTTS